GRIVELAEAERLFDSPKHPYTQALLSAVPGSQAGQRRIRLLGEVASPAAPPAGCPFHTRCPHPEVDETCRSLAPGLEVSGGPTLVACHKASRTP
ncbi:MAG: oligopeptide/dipeptide ABC transporter ATP-binding protein, partial [Planctomycetota bacterium]